MKFFQVKSVEDYHFSLFNEIRLVPLTEKEKESHFYQALHSILAEDLVVRENVPELSAVNC